MRAIVIDTIEKKIYETEYSGDFREIQKALDDSLFCVATDLGKGNCPEWEGENMACDTVFVDDEGWLKEVTHGFKINGQPEAAIPFFAGKGFVSGTNMSNGESCGASLPLEWYEKNVEFISL